MKNKLCVFVHLPKTSGETIKRSVECALPGSAMIRTSFEYFEPYFDIRTGNTEFYQGAEHFHHYLNDLSTSQKKQVKILAGHNSYYGIHAWFLQQARYVTFLREPLSRTVSLFNFERMAWDLYSSKSAPLNPLEINFLKRMQTHFLIDHQIPTFEQWLTERYDATFPFYFSMTRYLKYLGFPLFAGHAGLLQPFHFIGIAETHEEDALYVYRQLKIKAADADRNASTSFVCLSNLASPVMDLLIEKNADDLVLYQLAVEKNRLFKQLHAKGCLAKFTAKMKHHC